MRASRRSGTLDATRFLPGDGDRKNPQPKGWGFFYLGRHFAHRLVRAHVLFYLLEVCFQSCYPLVYVVNGVFDVPAAIGRKFSIKYFYDFVYLLGYRNHDLFERVYYDEHAGRDHACYENPVDNYWKCYIMWELLCEFQLFIDV